MEQPSSPFLRPRDVAKVSLSLAPAAAVPLDPPEAPADREFSTPVSKTFALPVVDPLVALADQWERQAAGIEALLIDSAAGLESQRLTVALLRENAQELRVTLQQKGGR